MPAPTQTNLIDVVTDHDLAVATIPRGEALDRGANFRTTHVFLFDKRGDLLLQRLAQSRERHPGRWGSSVAAYLHAGESYEEAARRRVQEELGLSPSLRRMGKIHMRDANSLKFVVLYVGRDGQAQINEPDHISRLARWPRSKIVRSLSDNPVTFTPTFRRLYETFGDRLP